MKQCLLINIFYGSVDYERVISDTGDIRGKKRFAES